MEVRANLHEMCKMKLPVPPGFTITTDSSTSWRKAGKKWPEGFRDQVREAMAWLEKETGKNFGDAKILYWYLCVLVLVFRCRE